MAVSFDVKPTVKRPLGSNKHSPSSLRESTAAECPGFPTTKCVGAYDARTGLLSRPDHWGRSGHRYVDLPEHPGAARDRGSAFRHPAGGHEQRSEQYLEIHRSHSGKGATTYEEKTRLLFWIIASMRAREYEWMQFKAGVLDEATWLSYRAVIFFVLGTQRARALSSLTAQYFNAEFVAMVSDMIKETPVMEYWDGVESVAQGGLQPIKRRVDNGLSSINEPMTVACLGSASRSSAEPDS
jgi:hypothetical protein